MEKKRPKSRVISPQAHQKELLAQATQAVEKFAPHFRELVETLARIASEDPPTLVVGEGEVKPPVLYQIMAAHHLNQICSRTLVEVPATREAVITFFETALLRYKRRNMAEKSRELNAAIAALVAKQGQESVQAKQMLASAINEMIDEAGADIIVPKTSQAAILLAINNEYGGRFVYSERESRKRSGSTKDIKNLLPFTFAFRDRTMITVIDERPETNATEPPTPSVD